MHSTCGNSRSAHSPAARFVSSTAIKRGPTSRVLSRDAAVPDLLGSGAGNVTRTGIRTCDTQLKHPRVRRFLGWYYICSILLFLLPYLRFVSCSVLSLLSSHLCTELSSLGYTRSWSRHSPGYTSSSDSQADLKHNIRITPTTLLAEPSPFVRTAGSFYTGIPSLAIGLEKLQSCCLYHRREATSE
jgi:hypothetical protein